MSCCTRCCYNLPFMQKYRRGRLDHPLVNRGDIQSGDTVLVLVPGQVVCTHGYVTSIIDETTYRVKYNYTEKGGAYKEKEEEFGFGCIIKPQNLDLKQAQKMIPKIESVNWANILLNGRDKEYVKTFDILCKILCKKYGDVLLSYDEMEEYSIHRGVFAARFIGCQVIDFLVMPKFRWKIKCIFCQNAVMDLNLVHKHRLDYIKTSNDVEGYCARGFSTIITYCDYCSRQIYQSEHEFRCMGMHDLCLNCFDGITNDHSVLYELLIQLLEHILNRDCIFEISCFVKGYVIKMPVNEI